ncbi:uncharacterized protein LOC120274666 [Dioscorea cayenensis subsp. rotundata]|uniref:Uncharacterized protein LOC120274666 n=1 Tax=Dioscorea cayennensis subsp. rotundata TaxID=55577 RepID=A0AB40CFN8_DIOCR|nr:uncharacterized protein LOC120274666 [Dioscorea cayenensis subsp. rotundata]
MGDGWSDQRQRTLINFLVYCPNGISFIKSVDASDIVKDATNLMNLFSEIVEWVGPSNVVHFVTDNASNYVAADCLLMVKIVAPIIKLLHVVDADEKPSLGYVYEGMIRIRKGIMSIFRDKQRLHDPYIKIVNERWDKHFQCNIYAAAYFLNPTFLYDESTFVETLKVMQGLLDLLEQRSICSNSAKAMKKIKIYRDRLGSFSSESALPASKNMQPDEWWKLFGHSAPYLQKVAIRLRSQIASSSGCERNWSLFERIHTKRRNKWEHQRLNDLEYVTYNLRLRQKHQHTKRSYDPVGYDCTDNTDFWAAENECPPELDYEKIMDDNVYGDDAIPIFDDHHGQDDVDIQEEVNLQDFGDVGGDVVGHASFDQRFDGNDDINLSFNPSSWT